MTKQGRSPSFSAFVLVGNRNGSAGIGYGKGSDVNIAIHNARRKAISTIVSIKRYQGSILAPLYFKFLKYEVKIVPRKFRKGLKSTGFGYEVAEAFGLTDLSIFLRGPRHNNRNKIICIFKALTEIHTTPELMSKARGKKFVDRNLLWQPPKEKRKQEEEMQQAYELLKTV